MSVKRNRGLILVGALLAVCAGCGPIKDFDYQAFQPAAYFLPCSYAEVDGIRIAYVESGPASAPTLVFIHGLLGRLDNWRYNLPAFADRYHVIALDLPGFGNSEMADREYTIELFARVVKGLMDQKDIAKATLIGNSMGGETAALFALRYPERVDKLVLVDAAGLMQERFPLCLLTRHTNKVAELVVHRAQRRSQGKSVEENYSKLKKTLFNPERKQRPPLAFDPKNPNILETGDSYARYYASLVKTREFEWHLKAALRSLRSIGATNLEKQVGAIRAPTLIVWGEEDQLIPKKFAELYRQGIPGSKLVWIKSAGHVPMIEKPEEFNQALGDFLAGN